MKHLSMASAIHSRRFWLAVVSAALVVANQGLGLNIPTGTVMSFAGIVIALILGDAYVQAKHVEKATQKEPTATKADAPQS